MGKAYGVSATAERLTGSRSRFSSSAGVGVGSCGLSASERRLRGEMEHMSHEVAVNRYMTPAAKSRHLRINALFACVVAAGVAVIGGIALLFHYHI